MPRRSESDIALDPAGEFPLPPEIYFLHLALVVARRSETRLEHALKATGVGLAGWRALRVVYRFGPATMGELADYSLTDRTTLTRIVDDLVEAGLMKRSKPPDDRRKVVMDLTAAGRRAAQKGLDIVSRELFDLMRDLPEGELRAADRLQQEIVTRLGESEQQVDRLLWRGDLRLKT
jgi:DNA-binding MarR family transcriptional regulator